MKYLLMLLISTTALAGDFKESNFVDLSFGVGVNDENSFGLVKSGYIAHKTNLYRLLNQRMEVGFWSDAVKNGRSGSMASFYSLGTKVVPNKFFIELFVGAGIISNTDTRLGSAFQFSEDLTIGVWDEDLISIGLTYKHISNAGIKQPNMGRDFLMIKLGLPIK